VARQEAALGVPLFRRSTRSVKLTDAGQLYFEQCRQALALIEDAERSLSEQQAEPRGRRFADMLVESCGTRAGGRGHEELRTPG
jgi:DNA-binding transcriptional LysR family regulator